MRWSFWLFTLFIGLPFYSLAYPSSIQHQIDQAIHHKLNNQLEKLSHQLGGTNSTLSVIPLILNNISVCPSTPVVKPLLHNKPLLGVFSVMLICHSKKVNWTLYDRVHTHVFANVVVSRKAIQPRHQITLTDLAYHHMDISNLRGGYFLHERVLIKKIATSYLSPGEIIAPYNIRQPYLIEIGDHLTINAQGYGIHISVSGIALRSGQLNQQIPVRNLNSHRKVYATVIGQDKVATHF